MVKRFLIGKVPGIWLLSPPVLCYQERSFYPPQGRLVFDSGAKAKPQRPPHDSIALLCPYGAARSVQSAAPKLERVLSMGPMHLGPPSPLIPSHGPCLLEINYIVY